MNRSSSHSLSRRACSASSSISCAQRLVIAMQKLQRDCLVDRDDARIASRRRKQAAHFGERRRDPGAGLAPFGTSGSARPAKRPRSASARPLRRPRLNASLGAELGIERRQ